jgi:hypothetical protein
MLIYAAEYAWADGDHVNRRRYVQAALDQLSVLRATHAVTGTDLDLVMIDQSIARGLLAGHWPGGVR